MSEDPSPRKYLQGFEADTPKDDDHAQDTLRMGNRQEEVHSRPTVFDIFSELAPPTNGTETKATTATETLIDKDENSEKILVTEGGLPPVPPSPPPPPPPPLPRIPRPAPISHKRTVSWGLDSPQPQDARERETSYGASSSIPHQPSLDSSFGRPPCFPRTSIQRKKLTALDLEELINETSPLECEAEASILKAIEEREPIRSQVSIIENIPDEAVSVMSESGMESADESNDGGRGTMSSDSGRGKPRIKSPQSPASRKKMHHRRTQTIEDKLFGLATAIDAMQDQQQLEEEEDGANEDEGASVRSRRSLAHAHAAITTTPSELVETYKPPAVSSHDAFQRNASILYRRMKNNAKVAVPDGETTPELEGSALTSTSSGKQKKGTRRTNPKKEDVNEKQSEAEVDEEIGEERNNGNKTERKRQAHFRSAAHSWYRRRWMSTDLLAFFEPRQKQIYLYLKIIVCYIMAPAIGISAILFYLAGNPPTGILQNGGLPVNGTELVNTDGEVVDPTKASASWWLLFVFARQLVTLSLALACEIFFVDYLSIHSGIMFKLLGAWPTLFIMQSRGWPSVAFFWATLDFALLAGMHPFYSHWLYWQPMLMFNESNPSGEVVDSTWNHLVLSIVLCVSFAVAVKRFCVGMYLGKKTCLQFSDKLAVAMKKILLISEVGWLGWDLERRDRGRGKSRRERLQSDSLVTEDKLEGLYQNAEDDTVSVNQATDTEWSIGRSGDKTMPVIDPTDRHPLTGKLNPAQEARMAQLLGSWEEPTNSRSIAPSVSVGTLLQFRRAVAFLHTDFPFAGRFGPAGTREEVITSSQEVYERLLLGSDDPDCLNFRVLAKLGIRKDGHLDQQKLKELIKLFRPDRDGTLSIVDFVKSIDTVYRELRFLGASVDNSSKIDSAFESILNIFFYAVVLVVVLAVVGENPLELFLAVSAIIVAFAFMIGPASSKYLEGMLFVLVRRPYDIGDGIHISHPNLDTAPQGSGAWLVKDINLFSTTVLFIMSKELATLSNGALADSRIINATQSTNAQLVNLIKFPIDVPYSKLVIFREALEQFIRNRPREWLGLTCFRAHRVEAAEGYVEYMIMGRHREAWVNIGGLRSSQAALLSFMIELSKKLDIRYMKPPMPVNLKYVQNEGDVNVRVPNRPVVNLQDDTLSLAFSQGSNNDNYSYTSALRGLQENFAPPSSK